jgi:phosphoglycolate phosphatase
MKILIDLDGTLLDPSERLYGLFNSLVPECDLDKQGYWNLKRAKVGHKQILSTRYGYTSQRIDSFEKAWMDLIEQQEWLKKDVLFEGVNAHLQMLSTKAELYLLTARQRSEMVSYQIDYFDIRCFFSGIFVTGGTISKDATVSALPLNYSDWLIGDTGHDVEVGKRLGVQTANVTNGFLSKESLLPYGADLIIDGFTDFFVVLNH